MDNWAVSALQKKKKLIWLYWILVVTRGIITLCCGIRNLVPWPGMVKPRAPELGVQGLSHRATWEVLVSVLLPRKLLVYYVLIYSWMTMVWPRPNVLVADSCSMSFYFIFSHLDYLELHLCGMQSSFVPWTLEPDHLSLNLSSIIKLLSISH